ncbi:MAG: hypothetical protein PHH05_03960 [Syntrophaceticus sp.]|nr:hypothetical protein [Syntrophaceticus sp.]
MKAVSKDKLPALLEELAKEGTVYVPCSSGDMSKFVPWAKDVEVDLEHNPTLSPKEVLFPQTEVIYNYKFGDENTVEVPPLAAKSSLSSGRALVTSRPSCVLMRFF